jgi:hypothetical protein
MKFFLITILIVAMLILTACSGVKEASPELINFAKCITESGTVMYGAYWCPHCINQKKGFGSAWEEINYVECSLPGNKGQTEICIQADIKSYPTWEFSPGDRLTGELPFEQLAAKTGCALP